MTSDDTTVPGPANLPERIGRYRVTGRVGKGAMGVVYSAYDEVMGRDVAVKVLMADLEGEPTMRARFYREAQAAGKLLHRNIITVFDIGEDDGRAFIVMELLKGQTLRDFVARPNVALEQKLDLMTQVCEGLQAAHSKGIFHRDIKPGNLFVLGDGTLKILDFGIARLASSTLTGTGAIIGTPDYMAPEQARGQEVDQRSDVFSSAAVFYFMLSGKEPFAASTLPATLRKVQFEDPATLDERDAPPALWRIIIKGLAKQPGDRYRSAIEMFADFVKFRREYEAGTREIATSALQRVRAIEAFAGERTQLAAWLGTQEPGGQPVVVQMLRDEAPAFVDQQPGRVLMVPFTRRRIETIDAELEAEHGRLLAAVEPLRAARGAVESGERLLGEGALDAALEQFENAGRLVPTAERLRLAGARYYQLRAERNLLASRQTAIAEAIETAVKAHDQAAATLVAAPATEEKPQMAATAVASPAAEKEPVATRTEHGFRRSVERLFGGVRALTSIVPKRTVLTGGAVFLVVLGAVGYALFFSGGGRPSLPSTPAGGDEQPIQSTTPPAATGTPAAVPSSPQQPAVSAAGGQPGSVGAERPQTPTGAAETRTAEKPIGKARPSRGQAAAAEAKRLRVLQERYTEATAALSNGDYTTAIAAFEAIVAEQPDYQDAADQLLTARRRAAQETARREHEAGVQAEAGGNYVAAVQHLERALKADPSLTEARDLMRSVRARMRVEGEDAYKRAKQYDALGRTTEAIAMYEKAVQMLAADHPLRASARERLDALRAIK